MGQILGPGCLGCGTGAKSVQEWGSLQGLSWYLSAGTWYHAGTCQQAPAWICPYPGHRGVFGVKSHLALALAQGQRNQQQGEAADISRPPQGEGL